MLNQIIEFKNFINQLINEFNYSLLKEIKISDNNWK